MMRSFWLRFSAVAGLAWGLAGCASGPLPPDWQVSAHGAAERATQADLQGLDRVATAEWRRALADVSATADPALLARLELLRCAVRQAALDAWFCTEHEARWPQPGAADGAYRQYLTGQSTSADVEWLPVQHQPVARHLADVAAASSPRAARPEPADLLRRINDPLARLVAAAALLRAGQASPEVVSLAIDTASAQGWRRPLHAWLLVAQRLAEQAGDAPAQQAIDARLRALAGEP